MRRLTIALLFLLLTATPAYAEDREWHADVPKQGTDGFHLCTGYAEAGGHTYKNTNYIDSSIVGNCDRYARADVVRYFRFAHGVDLDPSSVRVTVRPAR